MEEEQGRFAQDSCDFYLGKMKVRYLVYACIIVIVILISILMFSYKSYENYTRYLPALYLIMIAVFIWKGRRW